jgi:hypothetical protein
MICRFTNSRFQFCRSEKGIALVITLVMLAIVTVMAIIFLGLSRRERASVKVDEDISTARYMADAASERAKAEALAKMMSTGSKLHYDLFVSRDFIKTNGFIPQGGSTFPDPDNVSYVYANGSSVNQNDFMQVVANLQYDPRVPVFVPTNNSGQAEFRFFLDFDRNRRFEENGFLEEVDAAGVTNRVAGYKWMVGDPEWVGVLERPDLPHSETNRFIGRMAYLVLPVGKTLDLNFIHNQTDFKTGDDNMTPIPAKNGFARNQGYGPWEINLAAFLRELNTNIYAWPGATYRFLPQQSQTGFSFDDARALLNFRYTGRRSYLSNAFSIGPNNFAADFIDNYGDGPLVFGPYPDPDPKKNPLGNFSEDDPTRPWPGSLSSNAFTDVQQLFTVGNYSPGFTNRLQQPMAPTRKSTYDRYTFYRLLSQLGVDSSPAHKGKLNLNYQNTIGELTNNLIPWTNALAFFTNAADMMLKASVEQQVRTYGRAVYTNLFIGDTPVRPEFSLTNILIYATPRTNLNPNILIVTNEYTAATHRLLQVAVNIYDNTTNKGPRYPYYPTVFRPYFYKTATNLSVAGFFEITNITQIPPNWTNAATWVTQSPSEVGLFTNINVFGQPFIVGVKKGHPNFNEFTLENVVEISRKIELGKTAPSAPVTQTNEQFMVSIESRLGMEAWNSYRANYDRPLRIFAEMATDMALSNRPPSSVFEVPVMVWPTISTNKVLPPLVMWPGTTNRTVAGNIQVPLVRTINYLQDAVYTGTGPQYFVLSNSFFQPLIEAPHFRLYTTNRARFLLSVLSGPDAGRIIDFVNLDELKTVLDVGKLLRPQGASQVAGPTSTNEDDLFWDTNRIGSSKMTVGIMNQLAMSRGDLPMSTKNSKWQSYMKYAPPSDTDRERSIDEFRVFSGTNQVFTRDPILDPLKLGTRHQAPFTPTRRFYAEYSWLANDPLVHYMNTDLAPADANGRTLPLYEPAPAPVNVDLSTNWNIGLKNIVLGGTQRGYEPWGQNNGSGGAAASPTSYHLGVKDPNIRNSDDWRFPIVTSPTNYLRFPSIGWLGRVHRGTPWQTIYMKPVVVGIDNSTGKAVPLIDAQTWYEWAHNIGSFPSQDYKLFDLFTVAPTESAARGLLSVNQEGQAAWSAVLSGITVFTNNIADGDIGPTGPADPYSQGYGNLLIEPGSRQLSNIVASINFARTNQFDVGPVTDPARPQVTYDFYRKQVFGTRNNLDVFEHVGDVLNAPILSYLSPYLRRAGNQRLVWVDEAMERIPQQIMSLLQRDEPKFVVYAFGQSLKPAPHSLVTSANFYNLCTNYQITGEVISKTTFRVEGELNNAKNPLRAVVESYNVLPPPD